MLDDLARTRLDSDRRKRDRGWIDRTLALLSAIGIVERRMRALVLVQFDERADRDTIHALVARLRLTQGVWWVQEIGGTRDVLLMLDCAGAEEFVDRAEALLGANATVRRYEGFFVGRELKFTPFARLGA